MTELSFELRDGLKHLIPEHRWDVLTCHMLHANVRRRSWVGVRRVTAETGLSSATIVKALKWLVAHGALIPVVFHERSGEEKRLPPRANVYQITGRFVLEGERYKYLHLINRDDDVLVDETLPEKPADVLVAKTLSADAGFGADEKSNVLAAKTERIKDSESFTSVNDSSATASQPDGCIAIPVTPPQPVGKMRKTAPAYRFVCDCGAGAIGPWAAMKADGWQKRGALVKDGETPARCPSCVALQATPGAMLDAFIQASRVPAPVGFAFTPFMRLMGQFVQQGIALADMEEAGRIYGVWWVLAGKPTPVWTAQELTYTLRAAVQMVRGGLNARFVAEWLNEERGRDFWRGRVIQFGYVVQHCAWKREGVAG